MTEWNRIIRLEVATVRLPASHPRASAGSCTVDGFAITTPDGVVVVDTGPRAGHPIIDELYAPEVVDLIELLGAHRIDERDVIALVNTHLHFDHCGQNHLLPNAPVWTNHAELAAAAEPLFTVPDWAAIEGPRRRIASDGEAIAPGVRIMHTPGHTPGHQSVAIDTPVGLELVVGQACYECDEFDSRTPATADAHTSDSDGPSETAGENPWFEIGCESVERLRALDPATARFSHDRRLWHRS